MPMFYSNLIHYTKIIKLYMPGKPYSHLKLRSRKTTSENEDDRNTIQNFDGQFLEWQGKARQTACPLDS